MKVSPVEFLWREWRLGEGRFRGMGPASRPRPKSFPYRIPVSWWLRLAVFLARRKPPAPTIPAPFNGRGIVLLEPRGGTEDIFAAKQAGFTYILANTAYVSGGSWDTHRHRAAVYGLPVVPWRRVRSAADVIELERVAESWNAPAVAHNLEDEAMTTLTPPELAATVKALGYQRHRAVITQPWAQNGAGWKALSSWVAMPEAFLNADARWAPGVVTDHCRLEGTPLVVPMFGWGVWSDAPRVVSPATYLSQWSGPFTVYAGDGKETRYREWGGLAR